jgi:hypothetical protein
MVRMLKIVYVTLSQCRSVLGLVIFIVYKVFDGRLPVRIPNNDRIKIITPCKNSSSTRRYFHFMVWDGIEPNPETRMWPYFKLRKTKMKKHVYSSVGAT